MKTAKEFAAFRSSILALIALYNQKKPARPTLSLNPTAQEAIEYAEKLKAFESAQYPGFDIDDVPGELIQLVKEGISSRVADFAENDSHEFAPFDRPRVPHSIGELDHLKIAFYAQFLRAEWIANRFKVSVPTVYLDKRKETFTF